MEKLCLVKHNFDNSELGISLTTYKDNDDGIWFPAVKTARILGYKNPKKAVINNVDVKDTVIIYEIAENSGGQNFTPLDPDRRYVEKLFNEKGWWKLAMRSNAEIAEKLQDWVFGTVLPNIRKKGFYAFPGVLETIKSIEVCEVKELEDDDKTEFHRKSVKLSDVTKDPERVECGKLGGTALQKNLADMKADHERLLRNEGELLDRIWELEQELSDIVEFVENF